MDLLFVAAYSFACAVQPGPFQAWVLGRALSRGRRGALPAAFAPLISDVPVIAVVLLVLDSVGDVFLAALRIAGGLFLLTLAVRAWREWRSGRFDAPPPTPASDGRTLLEAALVNLLGPGPWLGWSLVLGPMLLEAWRASPAAGAALVATFYTTMVATLAVIIAAVAAAGRLGPGFRRRATLISAAALGAFGAYSLWTGIAAL